jgi:tetratricopeptide (TPR) repeat protein
MKYSILLLLIITSHLKAQNILKFDKKNTQCEDKWVAFQMQKDSTYMYGFIYIDYQAGLTFNYEGSFKVDSKGNFKKEKSSINNKTTAMKVRLQPNRVALAEIPESKFKELDIQKEPEWLEVYKVDKNNIEVLYHYGYMYNGYEECEKALTYLEKAEKINPNFKGLQTELAFSYNALGKYDKAINALQISIKNDPKDCYSLKELAFSYNYLEQLDKSAEVYNTMVSICSEKTFIQETAHNLAYQYFKIKDIQKFDFWDKEARKWSNKENQFTKNLDGMKSELSK